MPHFSNYPWPDVENLEAFASSEWTERLTQGLDGSAGDGPALLQILKEHSVPTLKRLHALEALLRDRLSCGEKSVEQATETRAKREVIRMLFVCAIAQQPVLVVGPPGAGKTQLVHGFCEGLGIRRIKGSRGHSLFEYGLHPFTEPDEILGVVDLEALRDTPPRFRRIRDGSITDAEVIFLDELFRANSPILNALLGLVNERHVNEGGETVRAKARVIIGATNRLPGPRQRDDLAGFFSRFMIRLFSQHMGPACQSSSHEEVLHLLQQGSLNEIRQQRGGYDPNRTALTPVSCLNDVLLLNRYLVEEWAANGTYRDFAGRYAHLAVGLARDQSESAQIDDRKFIKLFSVVLANAIFERNGAPGVDDLRILSHVWEHEDQRHVLAKRVDSFINENRTTPHRAAGA